MSDRLTADTIVDGRYRIIDRLGSGGMADVYCAEDLQLGRKVALKLLYRRFAEDAEFVERFRREASSAAGLQHPNVVGVYDRGEWDGTSYIAMEYIQGRTLKQVIQAHAPLAPAEAVDLITQVLRAARFAHKRGVIHRDLKPHNVMVDDEGRAKVTDFGIAKAGASEMTQTGSIMGTAQYLSPEQAQGLPVSAASDLYSVGIMLYEALTGRLPFDGDSAVTIALKQVNEAPVPPSTYNPAVSPSLDAVVLRALEKDPARRFTDADAFTSALEAAQLDGPGTATDQTMVLGPDTGPLVPPPVVALDTGSYAYPVRPLPPEPERDRRPWAIALLIGALVVLALIGGLLLLGGDKVTVPDVTGVPRADAQARLANEGFKTEVILRENDAKADTVIGQNPEAGSKAGKGDTITLSVSSGPGNAPVPDVIDLGQRTALRKLQAAGFEVTTTREASATIKKDHVIRTTPAAGTTAARQSTVSMVVSTGPTKSPVPDVVGQSLDDARTTLEDANFKVRVTEQVNADKDPDTVLAQDPVAGTSLAEGRTVTLTVAKAPDKVDVPDVTGKSADDATTTLSAAGFTVVVKRQTVTDETQDGTVISQSPSAGQAKAKKGAKVTITVGRYVAPTTPDPGGPTGPTGGTTP